MTCRSLLIAVPVLCVPLVATAVSARSQRAERATFSEDVAPILYRHCVSCHRPGESAPFPLISYEDAVKRGRLLASVTESRYMPPWRAAPGHGEFLNERRLADGDIAMIGAWVRSGMPRGDAATLPPLPAFADGWQLGTPDLVLEMPRAFEVPADGPDIYRNFAIPTGLTEDRWIRAVEFRPRARAVVHHALFQYARAGSAAKLEPPEGPPGFGGLAPLAWVPGYAPSGELGLWAVGATPRFLPEGLAVPLPKGTDVILQLHLHPTGKPEVEKAVIGLYFAPQAPERKLMNMGTPGFFGLLANIDIPPGEKHYVVHGTLPILVDMRAFSVTAHAHYLGKEITATATLPDGTVRPLLWIKDWDFNWQDQYTFKEPVLLPKGTRIDVRITYDNSADNPRNPNSPPARVQWGEESTDEMGGVRFQMVAVNKEDEQVLAQAIGAGLKQALAKAAQDGTLQRIAERLRKKRGGG